MRYIETIQVGGRILIPVNKIKFVAMNNDWTISIWVAENIFVERFSGNEYAARERYLDIRMAIQDE